jgi:hypothetical protein
MMNWKRHGKDRLFHSFEGLKENHENIDEDISLPCPDSKSRSPEEDAGGLARQLPCYAYLNIYYLFYYSVVQSNFE